MNLQPALGYNDHRNHNIDSLELAVSTWTPDRVAKASEKELIDLDNAYRELEILRLMGQGKTTAQIADEFFLSAETVKWYRKKLFAKFDVSNAAELIRKVTEGKII